jgi:glycosyltransferase involved in cell wall biosynthesis
VAPRVTVCTPTYNRRHTLPRVYESLCRQTAAGFEWLVVDDGSSDGTEALVAEWAAASPFPVRYLRQPNGGKHVAVRTGAAAAAGELMLVADSDDAFTPDTMEVFLRAWDAIPAGERAAFCGVACLCQDPDGTVVGDRYPAGVASSDFAELFFRWRLQGEKWWIVRTDLMRRFATGEPAGARQVPEGVTWFRIAREYKVRLVNAPLRIYHRDPDEPRLMRTPPARFAPGGAHYARMLLTEERRWFREAPGVFCQAAMNFARFSLHAGSGLAGQWRQLAGAARWLWLLCLPAGVMAYGIDLARGGRA